MVNGTIGTALVEAVRQVPALGVVAFLVWLIFSKALEIIQANTVALARLTEVIQQFHP